MYQYCCCAHSSYESELHKELETQVFQHMQVHWTYCVTATSTHSNDCKHFLNSKFLPFFSKL